MTDENVYLSRITGRGFGRYAEFKYLDTTGIVTRYDGYWNVDFGTGNDSFSIMNPELPYSGTWVSAVVEAHNRLAATIEAN